MRGAAGGMISVSWALLTWHSERSQRLNELVAAHMQVGGMQGPGRRTGTQQLNWALLLRLASEFQGFSRQLHTEGAEFAYAQIAATNRPLAEVTRGNLIRDLAISRGNAHPGALGKDFGRFGLDWWPELTAHDRHTPGRQAHLDRLNAARNAIVHDDTAAIGKMNRGSYPLRLVTYRRWRVALDGLAATMDAVLANHLGRLFGQPPAW